MDNKLNKLGWEIGTLSLHKEKIETLVEKKDYYLNTAIGEVEKEFNIKLTKFDSNQIEYIELVKAITRCLLRYDSISIELAKNIFQILLNGFQLPKTAVAFCTLPYPIIHFPGDLSEIGPRHKDAYDYIDEFYTTWTPLNNCYNNPIRITESTHKKNNFIVLKLNNYFKFFEKIMYSFKKTITPNIEIGEFAVWNGRTDHEGLLNTTKDTTVALVVRFTSSPIMYEASLNSNELESLAIKEKKIDTSLLVSKFIHIYKKVKELVKDNNSEPKKISDLIQKIDTSIKQFELEDDDLKRMSFFLTLWAQRLESKLNVGVFYLFALRGDYDNLYSITKGMEYVYKNYDKESLEYLISSILKKNNTIQSQFIIKEFLSNNNIAITNAEELNKNKADILKWH